MNKSFVFYVDNIPDWFFNKVCSDDIRLMNCNYNRYSIDEAYCTIKKNGVYEKLANGGDTIYLQGNDLRIVKNK